MLKNTILKITMKINRKNADRKKNSCVFSKLNSILFVLHFISKNKISGHQLRGNFALFSVFIAVFECYCPAHCPISVHFVVAILAILLLLSLELMKACAKYLLHVFLDSEAYN